MFGVILAVLRSLGAACQPRSDLPLENLALRHQLVVLQRNARKANFRNPGPVALDCPARSLVRMGEGIGDRTAANGGRLAPRGFPAVLALEVARPWSAVDR